MARDGLDFTALEDFTAALRQTAKVARRARVRTEDDSLSAYGGHRAGKGGDAEAMTVTEIRQAVTGVIRAADPAARMQNGDVSDPAIRGVYKIDVLPAGVSAACAASRERQAKVDIRYYPHAKYRPRDECDEVAERLVDAFAEGFRAVGTWMMPDEDVTFELKQGVLVMRFGISWSESAHENGEMMETLLYDREELTT